MQLHEEPVCRPASRDAAQATEKQFTAQSDLSWLWPRVLDQSKHRRLF